MPVLNTSSLFETIDVINEFYFLNKSLTKSERVEAARWIATRQGKPGSYAGTFAPMPDEATNGLRLFTGEFIRSRAGSCHIIGEEACRALMLLDGPAQVVAAALKTATMNMLGRIRANEIHGEVNGMYCCGACSVAYWRNITIGGLDRKEERLKAGMQSLKSLRKGDGKWRRFPFYYTLLALNEIETKSAIVEIQYAAPSLERSLKRLTGDDKYSQRRRLLAERILAKC